MDIRIDDLTGTQVRALLEEHLADMRATSPPESVHALDVASLRGPNVTFWSCWEGSELAGCAALLELDALRGEIKSMRTARGWRRRGVASALLHHLLAEAARRGYEAVYLETGATGHFEAARALYARHGFQRCGPFGPYSEDGHSFFMRLDLTRSPEAPADPADA